MPGPQLAPHSAGRGALGLFVGVRTFSPAAGIPDVPYAVDDAVDLAYQLSFAKDPRRRLLSPKDVRLALSGAPQKGESQARLAQLVALGARRVAATRDEVERWLGENETGDVSLLWVSFATHGRSMGGDDYLLMADSRLDALAVTAVPVHILLDHVARRTAALRVVVLDACREPLPGAGSPHRLPALELTVDAQSSGPLAVLRARVGGSLFDDDRSRQGVFTAALLSGLSCRAATDQRGRVTVSLLANHINREVAAWMKERLGLADDAAGVETHFGGTVGEQALIPCHDCPPQAQPDHLTAIGERLRVYAADGRLLWTRAASGRIAQAEIGDLDGDCSREVVVGISTEGSDTGWVRAFDCKGNEVWSVDTTAPSPYAWAGTSGRLAVARLALADVFGSGAAEVLALSYDAHGWFPSRLSIIDAAGRIQASYWHPGHLWHLLVGAAGADQPRRIVVAGKNNDLGAGVEGSEYVDVVLAFDPANVGGHGPPYHSDLERGTELWYGAILPKEVNVKALQITDRDHDGRNEIAVLMNRGHFLYLDFDGCPVASGRGDAAEGELRYGLVEGSLERCRGLH